jgi:hypothetical protein
MNQQEWLAAGSTTGRHTQKDFVDQKKAWPSKAMLFLFVVLL